MSAILDQARSLGNALARTDEYQAFRRAMREADDDREIAELRSRLQKLEEVLGAEMRAGREPDSEQVREYEAEAERLQANATYQRLVAAQANFDKVLQKVNATIAQGMEEGAKSRIILT
ncbi:MAG: YlbF family regulator [Longimicrobiales bacterium]|nr:YlbF family regulator [Longimicrobiales bacterium]